ncbi:MAG: N-(5'-phosphoribosyl)anthranilate isomerase [Acidobacteriota bacterium]
MVETTEMGIRWKVCGITSTADAAAAVAAGADALGFIFYPPSPRAVSLAEAMRIVAGLPEGVWRVGVFVDALVEEMAEAADRLGLDFLQLSGDEPPELASQLPRPAWKAVRLPPQPSPADADAMATTYPDCTLLLDAGAGGLYGGTGESVDWQLAARVARQRPLVLAGGLRFGNVAEAVTRVRPWGIDVASGVEAEPGRKDPQKLSLFAAALEPYR